MAYCLESARRIALAVSLQEMRFNISGGIGIASLEEAKLL
jgi:hypothetical protein